MTRKQELVWYATALAATLLVVGTGGYGVLLFVPIMLGVLIVYLKLLPRE